MIYNSQKKKKKYLKKPAYLLKIIFHPQFQDLYKWI
jgi:hypothetical protein